MENLIAFYWTLPINFIGFRPKWKTLEQACTKSKTIRYQWHAVRRYLQMNSDSHLIKEFWTVDNSPDRATYVILEELKKARVACEAHSANLIYVDFSIAGWRLNKLNLLEAFGGLENRMVPLPPEPIFIGGQKLDIISHFRKRREEADRLTSEKRETIYREVRELVRLGMSHASIADSLNIKSIKTFSGRPWTRDNVKKYRALWFREVPIVQPVGDRAITPLAHL